MNLVRICNMGLAVGLLIRNLIISILFLITLTSCNKEQTKINGLLQEDYKNVVVSMKSCSGKKEKILDTLEVDDYEFSIKNLAVKPPVRVSFTFDNTVTRNVWLFSYGKYTLNFNEKFKKSAEVNDSFEHSEYVRISSNYRKLYVDPIVEKEKWVKEHAELNLTGEQVDKLELYENKIKKAFKLRKRSILSTFRSSPQNPVAMGLIYEEYKNLTSWQKDECKKKAQKYFSDCGVNWQLKN